MALQARCMKSVLSRMFDDDDTIFKMLIEMTPDQRLNLYNALCFYCNKYDGTKLTYTKMRCQQCYFFKNGDIINGIDKKSTNYRNLCARCKEYICHHCGFKQSLCNGRIIRICHQCWRS